MLLTEHRLSCRVERGAALLDHHEPGWFRDVDPGTLNICSENNCLLGQLGRSRYGVPHLEPGAHGWGGYTFMMKRLEVRRPVRNGFLTYGAKERIERLWKVQIAIRLDDGATPELHSPVAPFESPDAGRSLVGAGTSA